MAIWNSNFQMNSTYKWFSKGVSFVPRKYTKSFLSSNHT